MISPDKFEVLGDGEQAERHALFYCNEDDMGDLLIAIRAALATPTIRMQNHRFKRLSAMLTIITNAKRP